MSSRRTIKVGECQLGIGLFSSRGEPGRVENHVLDFAPARSSWDSSSRLNRVRAEVLGVGSLARFGVARRRFTDAGNRPASRCVTRGSFPNSDAASSQGCRRLFCRTRTGCKFLGKSPLFYSSAKSDALSTSVQNHAIFASLYTNSDLTEIAAHRLACHQQHATV